MIVTKYGFLFVASFIATTAAQANGSWKEITKGVFQETAADGSVTTTAYGTEGANYDRVTLQNRADSLRNKLSSVNATAHDAEALTDTLLALEGIPASAPGVAQPQASTSGHVCGYNYSFDSHLTVGQVGATATARAVYFMPAFIQPPPLASEITYASATVTPIIGSAVTKTNSGSGILVGFGGRAIGVDADWTKWDFTGGYSITSSACQASTTAYIQLTGGTCGKVTGYVSQSKSYPSCTTSP